MFHARRLPLLIFVVIFYVIQCCTNEYEGMSCTNEYEGMKASDEAFGLGHSETAPIVLYH